MNKPNLKRMWETYVRLSAEDIPLGNHIERMRKEIIPLVSRLKDEGLIDWYCLLIHNYGTGVPTTPDDPNPYLHLRVSFTKDFSKDEVRKYLPTDLPETSPKPASGGSIDGVVKSWLRNDDIAEAWRIIGESTEWIFNMINTFKTDVAVRPCIYPCQIRQFLHYYRNALQMEIT